MKRSRRSERSAPPREIVFTEELRGETYVFHSTWGLFSPTEIDAGTHLLIERLDVREGETCFDLGCGYGPIGLVMARMSGTGRVWMADKDFVAVEYARRNVAENGLTNCEVLLSNGFEHLPSDVRFDVIAANLPANVGKELFRILFEDARERLNPGGRFFVVTVNGLREFIKSNFRTIFGNYAKLKQGRTHTVALARSEKGEPR